MKIAIDARIINSSTGRYVERLIRYLERIDSLNHYVIIVPERDKDYYVPAASNFSVQTVNFANYSIGEQIGFKRFLDTLNADIVHFCMPQQPIGYTGKTVTTFHDLTLLKTYNSDKNWLIYHIKQFVGRYVFKRAAQKSSHIITPTQYVKNDVLAFAHVPENKITVTYEAADPYTGTLEPVSLPFKQYLLYVGQQSDYKNIRRLGDAHQALLPFFPDLGLVLVGSKNAAAKANEQYFISKSYQNIHYTGFADDAQLAWLYRNTKAYVFPSLSEGFGLPGLEAMIYGAPLISSNATCLPEVYGDAALYFDPTSTADMTEKIISLLRDDALRTRLIEKGTARVAAYSWQRMAEQTHRIYLDVGRT